MHRINASGFAPGNLFTNGNPATGTPATVVDAGWLNDLQENLIRLVEALGVVPIEGEYTQMIEALLTRGIQRNAPAVAVAGGTANALTGAFTPAVATLTAGMTFTVRASAANTTTSPTFTPNSGVIAAKTIVKANNQALNAGDIAGAGHWITLTYDSTLDRWVLENPASTGASAQIQPITASVSSNALTLTLNPTRLDFRSPTLTNGAVNSRTVAAPISLTVPQGATLGATNGQPARLVLLAIDNAGTVELAVTNLDQSGNLDESGLINTTAISAAADFANVIYSASARTAVPYRIVGFIDSTQATAGTYTTAPSLIQGAGGQSLQHLQALVSGAFVSTTSGTSFDFTGIPVWVKRITCSFRSVSTNGSSPLMVQLGTSSGMTTSGYSSSLSAGAAANTYTTGFVAAFNGVAAANTQSGSLALTRVSGDSWSCAGVVGNDNAATNHSISIGSITLSGLLDRLRLTTLAGTDGFDNGTFNIFYE